MVSLLAGTIVFAMIPCALITVRFRHSLLDFSAIQLPGPFNVGVCTAFTATGSSLNTVSTFTLPDQRFLAYVKLNMILTIFQWAVKQFQISISGF